MVVFPPPMPAPERHHYDAPLPGKPPLFIMLDGTRRRRKCSAKSRLDALPMISVDLSRVSAYRLREAHAKAIVPLKSP